MQEASRIAAEPASREIASAAVASRLMRRATYASVTAAMLLIAAKLGAWFLTDSVAVLSTLVDSLLDAAASVLTLFAVHHAVQPADAEHRFGHGKAEALASLGQAAFVAGSGALLLIEAVRRAIEPRPLGYEAVGIGVMVFSIAVTFALVAYQRLVIHRTGSLAVQGDRLHYTGDLLINGSVIVALTLSWAWGLRAFDSLFAAGIVIYLLWNAYRIARLALDQLMDRELAEEDRARILAIAKAHPEARAVHDLRTRRSGFATFIQFHLELDPLMPLAQAHAIADAVEAEIRAAFPNAEIIIHQDPEGYEAEAVTGAAA